MKRFADYELTDEEILKIFGSKKSYEFDLDFFGKKPICGNTEKWRIARLLFLRGEYEESRKMIESIENDGYRRECLEDYASWGAAEDEFVN